MGTLIFWGVIVLGVFLGIVIISLLSMAQKGEQIYDLMYRGEEIATPANPLLSAGIRNPIAHQQRRGAAAERFKRISGGALITPEP